MRSEKWKVDDEGREEWREEKKTRGNDGVWHVKPPGNWGSSAEELPVGHFPPPTLLRAPNYLVVTKWLTIINKNIIGNIHMLDEI